MRRQCDRPVTTCNVRICGVVTQTFYPTNASAIVISTPGATPITHHIKIPTDLPLRFIQQTRRGPEAVNGVTFSLRFHYGRRNPYAAHLINIMAINKLALSRYLTPRHKFPAATQRQPSPCHPGGPQKSGRWRLRNAGSGRLSRPLAE